MDARERGSALITATIMLTVLGLFLFGFQAINRNEAIFAAYSRSGTLAFNLGEAGAWEGIKRLNLFGAVPGTTCFVNSLTSGAMCASSTSSPNANTVVYQAALSSNSAIFPILSLASTTGATRAVRVLVQAVSKTGFGNILLGPKITFAGDSSPVAGDSYSDTSITFASYAKSPQPGSGATATNLVTPQVLAGTTIDASAGGSSNPGPFTYECSSNSTTEVAPTGCARSTDSHSNIVPVNWHPMVPAAMSQADFTTVMNNCYPGGCAALGITTPQATQGGVGVSYTPVSYTPSYWSLAGATGKVWLAVATGPFCVNSSANTVTAPVGGACTSPANYYGQTSSTTRFLDWGLVSDDLTRGAAQTFFQAPSCTAPCANAGDQNGVRYIPLVPSINVLNIACNQNISPGTNGFANSTADGKTCANPPTTTVSISGTNVTFSGTKSSQEFLTIDNGSPGGTTIKVQGSLSGSNASCSTNFDNYNWGVIMATGDLDLQDNLVFSGFIYTPGNVYSHGKVVVRGGIFSTNNPSTGAGVNQVDNFGTVTFCVGSSAQLPLNPLFYSFSTTPVTWQDRPSGTP